MPFKLLAFHLLEYFEVNFTVVTVTSKLANPEFIIQNASRKKKKTVFCRFQKKKNHADFTHNEVM